MNLLLRINLALAIVFGSGALISGSGVPGASCKANAEREIRSRRPRS